MRPTDPVAPRGLPARGGLGLKPEHFRTVVETWPDIGFFEVHAENYLVAGGPFHHYLTRIRERYPLSIHGVGLSIGGEEPLDEAHLERLAALLERYQPESFSEHLAWSSHGGAFLNDLLPLPYHRGTLERVCEHIDRVQSRLKRTMLLENPASYLEFDASTLDEAEFIGEVLRRTGCGLLLDVNNAHVSCTNHGRDARAYLRALPLARVGEIHLAGFARDLDAAGRPLLIDSHGSPVAEEVWDLYRHALGLTGPVATLIERDNDLPAFPVLAAEACRAEDLIRAATPAATLTPPDQQRQFAEALLNPERATPAGLVAWNGSDPGRRFAVHRNNVAVSLIDALADTYPVVQQLVGEEFFRAMARVFARRQPPTSPVMAHYGAGFAGFIETFPPVAALPYLADLARLEYAYVQAYHAADAESLADDALRRQLADEAALPGLGIALHPSLALLSSPHPVVSLWAAHQGPDGVDGAGADLAAIDLDGPESALVLRAGLEVQVIRVAAGTADFVAGLARGKALGPATEAALARHPDFDLAATFALLVRSGAVTAILCPGADHERHPCLAA